MPKRAEKSIYKKTPRWYLIFSIVISILYIASNFLFDQAKSFWIYVGIIISFAWLILSIVMLVIFIRDKYEKGAVWLSSLYIFDFVFSLLVGIIFGIWATLNNIDSVSDNIILKISGSIFPLVTLILAIRLFNKK